MAFGKFELSRFRGSPIELFRFRYGVMVDEAYCYTNAEATRSHLGLDYTPIPLKRGKIASSTEDNSKTSLEIELPGDAEICELFRVTAPAGSITATIFQGHSRDPESEFLAIWTGRVTSCKWSSNGNKATLVCEPARSQLRRLALRRHYQYMCPHVLYGDQCRASETAATTQQTTYAVDGRLVTLAVEMPDPEMYLGGMVKWPDARGVTQARTILAVASVDGRTRFSLSGVANELAAGAVASVVRGCSHTLDGCASHNNVGNYGGQPFIPNSNPLGVNGAFS